jgi:RNA polymerase sigma factor (sigma-70 family)
MSTAAAQDGVDRVVGSEPADEELLGRFAASRDEHAFGLLVQRHSAMVLTTCRRMLQPADADDAFQATFLVLARKAGSIRKSGSLAGYLHRVAVRASGEVQRRAHRHDTGRKELAAMTTQPAADTQAWDDLRPILDQELDQLPDKYRQPLVLCYLEEKPRPQVAAQLHLTDGELKGRLDRGRAALKQRLVRRGVAVSAAVLGALLATQAAPAATASAASIAALVVAAKSFAAGTVGGLAGVSASAVGVAQSLLQSMAVGTAVTVLAVVALIAATAAGGVSTAVSTPAREAPATPLGPPAHGSDLTPPAEAAAAMERAKHPAGRPVASQPRPAERKALNLDLGKGLEMKLVLVPAGTFVMGSPADEPGRGKDEGPTRKVTIGKAFYMGIYEVTQEQYKHVMGNNPSRFKGPTRPVEEVSWEDAAHFCKKVSADTARKVRLPTEAQWEYACRAGSTGKFCFGDRNDDLHLYANYADRTCTAPWEGRKDANQTDGHDTTAPVGSFQPNAFGLYDMHGNVWEWVADWYAAYPSADQTDPTGPGGGTQRAMRGGCWDLVPLGCRSAERLFKPPHIRHWVLGFRVAVEAE